jgi:hypothetical protein
MTLEMRTIAIMGFLQAHKRQNIDVLIRKQHSRVVYDDLYP